MDVAMPMKKTAVVLSGVIVAGLLFPRTARAQFGGDIAYLWQLVQEAQRMYRLERQTQQVALQTANFFAHPSWRNMLQNSLNSAQSWSTKSNGSDAVTVKTLDDSMRTADAALKEAETMQQMSTNDAGLLSLLELNTAQAKAERDRIAADLDYEQQVGIASQNGIGLGAISQSIASWQPR